MGNMFLAASTKSSGSSLLPILFIAVLFVVLYLVMIRPQRNRQRQAMQMQRTVVPGQRVRTTAGMYGTITAVDDNDVEVEVAPGVRIKMLRRAIMDTLSDEGPGDEPQSGEAQSAEAQTNFSDGQAQTTFGENAADDWNPQDRNPQV
jgi:preprotein translocase subunit YajC